MRPYRLFLTTLVFALFVVSCKKDHYDVSNVHGVNAEGEVLAPLASASFTVKDLMERFGLLDLLYWTADGDIALHYTMQMDSILEGYEILKFNDLDYEEHYTYPNPFPNTPPPYLDTVLSFERTITFESEHVFVKEGFVKSGRLEFTMESNVGNLKHVVLRTSNIKDVAGNDFVLDTPIQDNAFVIMNLNESASVQNDAQIYCWASSINSGARHDHVFRIVGSKASIEWDDERPNQLLYEIEGEPRRILERGAGYLYPEARVEDRISSGHAEGLFDAWANLYRRFAAAMRGVGSEAYDDFWYPDVKAGATGVKWIEKCVESADNGSKWVAF